MYVETIEDIFKRELIQQFAECEKHIIPKTEYTTLLTS